ncbi:hypothetical protein [Reyranella sp. CPCC 100927]|uniref:hypothetical protein n=1 Tax=Reyranella sp. CPCC 100927 TaxID=2599616 RepID=UPI0011B5BD11|nr:hypothetical protein [Reyranella sp. CPCC 100927]TWT13762.1 hypothetical protein FQU96_07560 [Reyranella sp. CPCC 100927]
MMFKAPILNRRLILATAAIMFALPAASQAQRPQPWVPPLSSEINALLADGEPIGWASPQAMAESLQGMVVAPDQRERWMEEAQALAKVPPLPPAGSDSKPPPRVARNGTMLTLSIAHDKHLRLFDQGLFGWENHKEHAFDAWLPDIGYYSVRVSGYEETYYYVIAATNGAITITGGQPMVAPDRSRVLAWDDSPHSGRWLQVLTLTSNGAVPEKIVWEPTEDPEVTFVVRWASDSSAVLIDEKRGQSEPLTIRLVLKDGAWRTQ